MAEHSYAALRPVLIAIGFAAATARCISKVNPRPAQRKTLVTGALALGWAALVGGGLAWSVRYAFAVGDPGSPAATRPDVEEVKRAPKGLTLVVAIHPRCPCSAATASVLTEMCSAPGSDGSLVALVAAPPDSAAEWRETSLVSTLRAIPAASVLFDDAGRIAERFGLRTSGHVLAYDPEGHLLFSGGVTPSRGELGPSAGAEALARLWLPGHDPQAAAAASPVYGCRLVSPHECALCGRAR